MLALEHLNADATDSKIIHPTNSDKVIIEAFAKTLQSQTPAEFAEEQGTFASILCTINLEEKN